VTVDVIHDERATRNTYAYPDTSGLSISDVEDTDGIAGDEIIVLYTKASTSQKLVDVIHDSTATRNSYDFGVVTGLRIDDVQDYDGVTGAEIAVDWWIGANTGQNLIVDRTRTVLTAGPSLRRLPFP